MLLIVRIQLEHFLAYTLFLFATCFTVPHHTLYVSLTYTEQIMNSFHEVNEIYDGTMNVVQHFCFHTNISSNECFKFQQVMKKEDIILFLEGKAK